MVTKKEILRLLVERRIPAVLIGGLALRIYNSPRVTHDMDLAIRSLDTGRVIELMYERGFRLVSAVGERDAELPPSALEASAWVEGSGASSTPPSTPAEGRTTACFGRPVGRLPWCCLPRP